MIAERIDAGAFERFEAGGIVIYVEKGLLAGRSIDFTVVSAGDFTISLIR